MHNSVPAELTPSAKAAMVTRRIQARFKVMTRTFLAFAAVLAALPAQAQVYKCVEAGRTIYSQTPCPSNAASSTTINRNAPATPAPGAPGTQSTAEREQAFRKRQQEQQDAAKKDSQKQAEAKEQQQNCNVARSQLAQYEAGGRISRMDANGERQFLGDAELEQEKARARTLIGQWCK
jgi:uncharacterized protein DUF4124